MPLGRMLVGEQAFGVYSQFGCIWVCFCCVTCPALRFAGIAHMHHHAGYVVLGIMIACWCLIPSPVTVVKCSGKSHLGDNGLNYYQVVVIGYLYPLSCLLTVVFFSFISLSLFFSLMRTPSFFFFEIEARTDFRRRITFIVEFSAFFNICNL